ncbi:MAG: hypothetical protein P8J20_10170 [Novosphingobium sp.]|nr:hypothetical protein [Novosphingobium sp.]
MGLAAALLVFTGFWHLTEFLMDRKSVDAQSLIPFGAAYLLLGILIALGIGGVIIGAITLLVVVGGMVLAFRRRKTMDIRRWVMWAFIIIGLIIAIAIIRQWL